MSKKSKKTHGREYTILICVALILILYFIFQSTYSNKKPVISTFDDTIKKYCEDKLHVSSLDIDRPREYYLLYSQLPLTFNPTNVTFIPRKPDTEYVDCDIASSYVDFQVNSKGMDTWITMGSPKEEEYILPISFESNIARLQLQLPNNFEHSYLEFTLPLKISDEQFSSNDGTFKVQIKLIADRIFSVNNGMKISIRAATRPLAELNNTFDHIFAAYTTCTEKVCIITNKEALWDAIQSIPSAEILNATDAYRKSIENIFTSVQ